MQLAKPKSRLAIVDNALLNSAASCQCTALQIMSGLGSRVSDLAPNKPHSLLTTGKYAMMRALGNAHIFCSGSVNDTITGWKLYPPSLVAEPSEYSV